MAKYKKDYEKWGGRELTLPEWDLAPKRATQLLKLGMVTIIVAIVIVAIGQGLSVEKASDSDTSVRIFQNAPTVYPDS